MDDDGTAWFRLPVASASRATGAVCLVLYRLPLTFSGSEILMDGRPEESTGSVGFIRLRCTLFHSCCYCVAGTYVTTCTSQSPANLSHACGL